MSTINRREGMLKNLLVKYFCALDENAIEYCVIGNYDYLPEYTENDVDLWVSNIKKAEKLLLRLARSMGLTLYMQNKIANGTNNYFYALDANEINIVKIDLMSETAYKSIIPIVPGELIQSNRIKYNDFFVANDLIEGVMHLLYPLVTFGIVKQKYRKKILHLSWSTEFKDYIVNILGYKLGECITANIQEEEWGAVEKSVTKIKTYLVINTLFKPNIKRLLIIVDFFYCGLLRVFKKNGIVIGFTGIDGAGKSTIKKYLIENADRYFTKNRKKEFYWRPFLLPRIAKVLGSQGQAEVLDRSGKRVLNQSVMAYIKSLLKYLYYVADFTIGQIKYFKQAHTGGLVVFDRYHFDNLIYPERFGFKLDKKIMRIFDKHIIPQPDILFYFTAESDILYKRKHEIDLKEIEHQKHIYAKEMRSREGVVMISTDQSLEDSVGDVLLKCFEEMSSRYT